MSCQNIVSAAGNKLHSEAAQAYIAEIEKIGQKG